MKVLFATDLAATSLMARALLSSLTWPRGAELEVLHVAPQGSTGPAVSSSERGLAARKKETATFARELAAQLAGREVSVRSNLRVGDPATVTVERGDEMGADLIVVGSRGRGHIARTILGTVSAGVVERASCSALAARTETIRSLMLVDDGQVSAHAALEAILDGSLFQAVHVTVARVVDLQVRLGEGLFQERIAYEHRDRLLVSRSRQATAAVDKRVAGLRAAGRMATGRVLQGDAATELLSAARGVGADLIVMGADSGAHEPQARLGDVSRRVLLGFRGSVLIARSPAAPDLRTSHRRSTTNAIA